MIPKGNGVGYFRASGVTIPWFDGDRLTLVKIRQPERCKPKYADGTGQRNGVNFGQHEGSAAGGCMRCDMIRACATLLGTLPKARSQSESGIWRDKAWNGRAGQAFALVESGVVDRATANSPPQTAAGHKQDDQTAKTKPPAGSCSRILDQSLGSTRARSSRNRPLE